MLRELRAPEAQGGAVLLFALIAVMIGLALTGAMVSVSIADARSLREHQQNAQAFYVAEAGLQGSHYELADHLDPGADGQGNLAGALGSGSYKVTAKDLGNNYFRLTSMGEFGDSDVTIEEVVERVPTSRFPGGAISMVGDMSTSQVLFSGTTDLIVDGGDSPGVVFTDGDLYKSITTQFAQAVGLGYLQEMDITGSVTNNFQPNDVDLSMAYNSASGNHSLTIYPTMYTEFFNHINNNMQSSAIKGQLGTSSYSWGSESAPVNYWFPGNQRIKAGQTLTGYGTLIFSQNLIMDPGSRIDWNGNLIIFGGDNQSDAFLECDGLLNVTGNVILVGPKDRSVKFLLKSQGQAAVNGAFTVMADLANSASKLEFYVENDLKVDGLLTTVASIQQTEFKAGSDTVINGQFQIGRPDDAVGATNLQLKFDDHVEVYKSDDMIEYGAAAIESLGGNLFDPILGDTLNRREIRTLSWRKLPNTQ